MTSLLLRDDRRRRPARFLLWLLGVLVLVAYGAVLIDRTSFVAGGSDSSGYLNAARLFARRKVVERVEAPGRLGLPDADSRMFIPLGFSPGPRPGTMAPSYPPGLPLHMAVAALFGGWARPPFLVVPIAAVLCLILTYLIGRELGLPRSFSVGGSVLLAVCPTFVSLSVEPMSDVPAAAWAMAAVLAALRARRSPNWALLAGAAFGMAVLVRPTDILLAAPLLAVLPWRPRVSARVVLGGLPFTAFWLLYNRAAFGSPLSTGYGTILAGGMALANFPARIQHYGHWLVALMSPVVAMGWMAVAADRRVPRRDRALLILWFGAFLLFYCFYAIYDAWWYTRFLLPGIPAMILATLLVARDWLKSRASGTGPNPGPTRLQWAAALLLFLEVVGIGVYHIDHFRLLWAFEGDAIYPAASHWAEASVPSNALVASMQMSGALKYYTKLTYARWDWIEPDRFASLRSHVEGRGYRWYALIAPFEEELFQRLPGKWRQIGKLRDIGLWQLEP